jgi:hypothetical protein
MRVVTLDALREATLRDLDEALDAGSPTIGHRHLDALIHGVPAARDHGGRMYTTLRRSYHRVLKSGAGDWTTVVATPGR